MSKNTCTLLMAVAVMVGLGLTNLSAAPLPTPEPEKKEPEKKPEPGKNPAGLPNLEDLQRMIQQQLPGNLTPEEMQKLQQQIADAFRQLQQMQNQFPNLPMQPGVPGRVVPIRRPNVMTPAEGRFGAKLAPISETLEQQLDLPKGQGQVVGKVDKDSAADKAGLKEHDIVLELDGKKVPSDAAEFAKLVEEIKINTPVDAVVLRKGKKTEVKGVSLPEAPPQPVKPPIRIRPGGIQIMPIQPGNIIPIQPGNFPGLPGGVTAISIAKNGNETTITQKDGTTQTRVVVVEENGKQEVKEIAITEDNKETTYPSLDKVPDAHKDSVKKLIEMANGKGQFKFDFRALPVPD